MDSLSPRLTVGSFIPTASGFKSRWLHSRLQKQLQKHFLMEGYVSARHNLHTFCSIDVLCTEEDHLTAAPSEGETFSFSSHDASLIDRTLSIVFLAAGCASLERQRTFHVTSPNGVTY